MGKVLSMLLLACALAGCNQGRKVAMAQCFDRCTIQDNECIKIFGGACVPKEPR